METDDCIVCDKCVRICPVDCITIESFKAVDDLGTTSSGASKKIELPVFDIDMAKCCFCGLCTTVCPTECLTMTKVYDYATTDRDQLLYHFGNLSPKQEIEKRERAGKPKIDS
jgi:formate hydrogenlyase subunit 6/NADH:ubiquinone oxidoreductase subunit I